MNLLSLRNTFFNNPDALFDLTLQYFINIQALFILRLYDSVSSMCNVNMRVGLMPSCHGLLSLYLNYCLSIKKIIDNSFTALESSPGEAELYYPQFSLCFSLFLFFFHRHSQLLRQHGKRGDHLYSSLLISLARKHSDIFLKLCIWDDYHIFSITSHLITRLLLDEICHQRELPFDLFLMKC